MMFIGLNFVTVATDVTKWFSYFKYTVSDVIRRYDGKCWTYNMADVIALFNNVVDVDTTYCWLLSQV